MSNAGSNNITSSSSDTKEMIAQKIASVAPFDIIISVVGFISLFNVLE